MALKYTRVLLKISGEALMGPEAFGHHQPTVNAIIDEIVEAYNEGAQIALVVGAGNYMRGSTLADAGLDRVSADHMGMLAIVINGIALAGALREKGIDARVMSAFPIQGICETYSRAKAVHHLGVGRVTIFVAGIGQPFFTTDTTAALRAAEIDADVILKGTQVDGVYTADPKIDSSARRYETVTFDEAIAKDLKVMDTAAFALARDSDTPIVVYSLTTSGGLVAVLKGEGVCTTVTNALSAAPAH